ncbi:MAG: hypothetical protein WC951_08010 [Bacteroidales bacterium]
MLYGYYGFNLGLFKNNMITRALQDILWDKIGSGKAIILVGATQVGKQR